MLNFGNYNIYFVCVFLRLSISLLPSTNPGTLGSLLCHYSRDPKEKRSMQGLNVNFFGLWTFVVVRVRFFTGIFDRERSVSWSFPRRIVLSWEGLLLSR